MDIDDEFGYNKAIDLGEPYTASTQPTEVAASQDHRLTSSGLCGGVDDMGTGFYDIDDIIASQERVPCKFSKDFEGLGYLDPNAKITNAQNVWGFVYRRSR
eukprot:Platyproteum_vivax@DN6400_c0_g1_i1.p2